MRTIKINCPRCQQKIEMPRTMQGHQLDCPTCAQHFTAPIRARNTKWFLIGLVITLAIVGWKMYAYQMEMSRMLSR